jgi:hypothetical protein
MNAASRNATAVGPLQVFLLALVVVGLHFSGQLVTLRTEVTRYYYLWRPVDAAARVLDILALAAVLAILAIVVDRATQRLAGPRVLAAARRVYGHVFLLGLVSGLLAVPVPLAINHPRAFNVLWVAVAGVLGFSLGWSGSPLVRWGRWVALGLLVPLVAAFGWTATWTGWHDPPRTPPPGGVADEAEAIHEAADAPADRAAPVLFLVFDEWSPQRSMVGCRWRRGPNIARLAEKAITFSNARSPYRSSEYAIPRLLLQNDLSFRRDGGRIRWLTPQGPVPSPEMPSLFSMAKEHGYTTCLAGWFLPYQRLFGRQLDYCGPIRSYFNRGEHLPGEMFHAGLAALGNMTDPLSRRVWGPIQKRVNARRRWQIEQDLKREILGLIDRGPPKTMAVFHIPLPHQPFIFNEDGSYRPVYDADSAEGYLRNLRYADRVLGKCLERLKATGKFDPALLVVTSNHGWREEPEPDYRRGPHWKRRVPLVIKLPGQKSKRCIGHPIETNRLRPLVEAVFSGTTDPEALNGVVEEIVDAP